MGMTYPKFSEVSLSVADPSFTDGANPVDKFEMNTETNMIQVEVDTAGLSPMNVSRRKRVTGEGDEGGELNLHSF